MLPKVSSRVFEFLDFGAGLVTWLLCGKHRFGSPSANLRSHPPENLRVVLVVFHWVVLSVFWAIEFWALILCRAHKRKGNIAWRSESKFECAANRNYIDTFCVVQMTLQSGSVNILHVEQLQACSLRKTAAIPSFPSKTQNKDSALPCKAKTGDPPPPPPPIFVRNWHRIGGGHAHPQQRERVWVPVLGHDRLGLRHGQARKT